METTHTVMWILVLFLVNSTVSIQLRSAKPWKQAQNDCISEGKVLPTRIECEEFGIPVWINVREAIELKSVKKACITEKVVSRHLPKGSVSYLFKNSTIEPLQCIQLCYKTPFNTYAAMKRENCCCFNADILTTSKESKSECSEKCEKDCYRVFEITKNFKYLENESDGDDELCRYVTLGESEDAEPSHRKCNKTLPFICSLGKIARCHGDLKLPVSTNTSGTDDINTSTQYETTGYENMVTTHTIRRYGKLFSLRISMNVWIPITSLTVLSSIIIALLSALVIAHRKKCLLEIRNQELENQDQIILPRSRNSFQNDVYRYNIVNMSDDEDAQIFNYAVSPEVRPLEQDGEGNRSAESDDDCPYVDIQEGNYDHLFCNRQKRDLNG